MKQPVDGEWYEANDDKWYCWPDPTPHDGPPSEQPPPPPPAAPRARSVTSLLARVLLVGGIVILAVGCLMPWYQDVVGTTAAGTRFDDGKLFLAGAGVLAVLTAIVLRQSDRRPLFLVLALLSALAVLGSAADVGSLRDAAEAFGGDVLAGIYVTVLGAVLATVGALKGLVEGKPQT